MNAVVDASLLVAATADAGPEGVHLVLAEATNVLRRPELAGRLTRLEARRAARDLLLPDLRLVPFAPFSDRGWGRRADLTSYDAFAS